MEYFNLTKPQKLIYNEEKTIGGSIANICGSILFDGKGDKSQINAVLKRICNLNSVTKIHIKDDPESPKQYIGQDPQICVLTFRDKSDFENFASAQAQTPIGISESLCEFYGVMLPNEYGIFVKMHHLIGDAWTLTLIGKQFAALYSDISAEIEAYSYFEQIKNEQNYIESPRFEKDKEYWYTQLSKCDDPVFLSDKAAIGTKSARFSVSLKKEKTAMILQYCAQKNISPFHLFLTAFGCYINRVRNGVKDFYIGTAVLNRSNIIEKNTMGMFINTIPLHLHIDEEETFEEAATEVKYVCMQAFRHQKFNYGDILELNREKNNGGALYDVIISYQNAELDVAGAHSAWYHCGEQKEALQIHFDDRDKSGALTINYDYLTELFNAQEINRLHEHLFNMIFDEIENCGISEYDYYISNIPEDEKPDPNEIDITIGKPIANTQIYILDKYLNPVPIGVPGELCIAGDGVGAGYLNRPELTAEKFVDNPFGEGKMYKTGDIAKWRYDGNIEFIGRNDFQVKIRGLRIELGEIENAMSSFSGIKQAVVIADKDDNGHQYLVGYYSLIEQGIKVGDIVAFKLHRRSYLIATMFGILKAGAAYMPIDPDYPQDRIEYMLSDSNAKLCIIDEDIPNLLNNVKTENPNVEMTSDNICYCIYTSGSTGKPKGTLLIHSNVVNYVHNNNNNVVHSIIKEEYKTIVSVTTVGFDIFVTESILPLCNGMKILFANEEQARIQKDLNDLLKNHPADVIQTTPTKMKMLIADKAEIDYLKTIKVIILGGEALDETLVNDLKDLTDAEIFNIYGPTEATVWSTNARITTNITHKSIAKLSSLSFPELKRLASDFIKTKADCRKEACVHQIFENQSELYHDKTAVIACDKVLTYGELNEQANRIAHGLIESGVKIGDIVAFKLPRRSYLIATMFGILKAGAAYMPIDPNYPQDRIDYMLTDSKAKICITDEDIPTLLNNDKTENPNVETTSDNICYCIYTSGSTGKPKAVLIKNKSVVNFCNAVDENEFQKNLIEFCKTILCTNSICFDITVQEIHLPLLNGKTVLLVNEDGIYNAENMQYLSNYTDLGLVTTPTKLDLFIRSEFFCNVLKNFNVIMVGAEKFPENLYDTLKKYTKAIIYNGFGPTETTCGISYCQISSNDISIGKPIANTQVYIVDKRMRLVPIGVTGELCIAGDGVGAGYLNRPELTAEKFVDNPFGEDKMYKTGDLAYWREDGNIMYVGRNDFQVKIRGLRIELGEIENAICSVDGIMQSVVIVRKDDSGRQLICAFYTGKEKDAKDIRSEISKRLPKYMLPHFITHIEAMPLTSSGKINRNALPEIDLTAMQNESDYVAPKTETEKALCKMLEEILEYSPIGTKDSFFDIGGDSLKAIEFVSKAHSDGIMFTLQNVFDYPTVKELCKAMQNSDKPHVEYNQADFEKYKPILEKNILKADFRLKKNPIGNVLLTGSTGFLGCHIIDKFLQVETGKIYCLVRGNAERLWDKLYHYFGDKYKDCDRIIPIVGDMESLNEFEIPDVDTVIHTAASVKHYGSYKYFYDINVGGTKAAIEFAKKHNAKLIHISTISVSGNSMADAFDAYRSEEELFFSEQTLYVGQSLDNVYIRSKFEAERAVLDAMLNGLQANIIRVGNLTNRESDGKFQPNYESNAFLKRVKAVLEFGYFPDYLMPLYSEFSPIDCTADAIIKIAEHFNDEYTVFNVNSEKGLYFDKMFEILPKLNINMKVVSSEEFLQKLNTPETQFVYEALINDMDENSKLVYDSNIHIVNDFTVEYLRQLGFEWPEIGYDYLEKYINYFRNIGFLEV